MAAPWPQISAPLRLLSREVTIFYLDLEVPEAHLPALAALMGMEERSRAGRLMRECDRRRFIAAHGQMRQVLAACLRTEPEAIEFNTTPNGKPYIEGSRLQFNLSHSQGVALLAVSVDAEVGVDIEQIRDTVDFADIARHFFAPGEVAALFALPEEKQLEAFFTTWTRKEAYMKASGLGMSIPLDAFEVSVGSGSPPRLINLPASEDWELYDVPISPRYAASVAVPVPVGPPALYSWPTP